MKTGCSIFGPSCIRLTTLNTGLWALGQACNQRQFLVGK